MPHPLPRTLFPFIWHFLKRHKIPVFFYTTLAISAGFWSPFNAMLVKRLINLLANTQEEDVSNLVIPSILVVLNFTFFNHLTWRGISYIRAKFIPSIINRIIGESMEFVMGKSHQFFQDNLSGKISKQITNLADGIERLINSIASNFLRGSSLLLTAILTAYFVNPLFCLILIAWFILFATTSILMSKRLVTYSSKQALAESVVVGELVDTLSNQMNVRIFSRKSYENGRMIPFFKQQQKAYTATGFYSLLMNSIQGTLIAVMMASSSFCLIYLYSKKLVSVGDFALILGLSMDTAYMMWFTMTEVDEFNKIVGRCRQTLTTILLPQEISDKPDSHELKCTQGKITFDKVRFHYKEGTPLFLNTSIQIKAGEKVGLVGYSGGGKSTFVNLIMRLYDVTDGAILIDDQDVRDVSQDSLRTNISMIPQDPILFQRSLLENIRYGRTDASDEEVFEAAQKAHADEFIQKLELAYHSLVGERGIKLSGGQRQRIAIARAFLKNAPILILDEATSQLDSVTENLIQESLWDLMKDKTTIVIAHRLSTLLHMDRILVFDQGQIVEDGTHLELLEKEGLYKTLWNAQVGGFLSEESHDS